MGVVGSKKKVKTKKLQKEEQYVDQLEKEIRELKYINRSLMKQLKKMSKGINKLEFEQALERLDDEKEQTKAPRGKCCPECAGNRLREIEVAGRRFERCEQCGYKSGRIK